MHSLNHNLNTMRQIVETQRIYTSIYESPSQEPPQTLLVTSASPAEGKTTLAAGLGLLAAENQEKRILVMDLNWYNPALHSCFGLEPKHSFEDLVQTDELNHFIQGVEGSGLKVITAPAQSDPQNQVSKETLSAGRKLILQAAQKFDRVILDSASVFPMNRQMLDPVNIGSLADSTLMVVMANSTKRSTAKRAKVTLESSRANLLGLVVNHHLNPLK